MAFAYPDFIALFIGDRFCRCSRNPIPSCVIDPTEDSARQYIKYRSKFEMFLSTTSALLKFTSVPQICLMLRSAHPWLRKRLREIRSSCFDHIWQLNAMEDGTLWQISLSGWDHLLDAHNQSVAIEVDLDRIIDTLAIALNNTL